MRKFVRTRPPHAAEPAPPAPPPLPEHRYTNGHAGVAGDGLVPTEAGGAELHSTLSSRYWSGSSQTGGCGGGGGGLWEDEEFPCTWRSLGERRLSAGVLWLRPHELCPRPRFRGDTALEADAPGPEPPARAALRLRVSVGAGGPALPAAAAALAAAAPRLLSRVAPHQSFRDHYTGAFTFRMWVFGSWVCVRVDDRLPTRGGRLLSSHCALPGDFTLPLLEKAFAKLVGGYGSARRRSSALAELTGCVVQELHTARTPHARLLHVLRVALPRATLLLATVEPQDKKARRAGVEPGQAYVVEGLAAAPDRLRMRCLAAPPPPPPAAAHALRAHNGHAGEEDGRYEPGTFWVTVAQFCSLFSRLELAHVSPDDWLLEPALRMRTPWRAVLARRTLTPGYNAGGPPHCSTTGANPQFHVSVPAEAGGGAGGGGCHAVVSVSQRGARRDVGFAVYELPAHAPPGRVSLPGPRMLEVTHSGRAREVAALCVLRAGLYLVVPHAAHAHARAALLLRLYTDCRADVWEANEDNTILRSIDEELQHHQQLPDTHARQRSRLRTDEEESEAGLDAAALGARLHVRRGPARALLVLHAPAHTLPPAMLPALHHLLHYWQHGFRTAGQARRVGLCPARRRASSYRLRQALDACGVRVSNKVLEAMVLRFSSPPALTHIDEDAFLHALATIHLAHQRYRMLESRMKSIPLSLEEMILMTIYT